MHDGSRMISSVFMTNEQSEDWMKRQAAAVGARVRRVRLAVGMSVQAVADRCTNDLGYKMLRTTLVNLESGARRNITLAEISVLAKALDVPPLGLLFPVDEPELVEVLPGVMVTPWDAWQWFAEGVGPQSKPPTNAPARQIREALIEYVLLVANGRAWEHIGSVIRGVGSMGGSEESRASLRKDSEEIIGDTYDALEYLESRSLPLPDISERWIAELRRSRAKSDALLRQMGHDDA